jgi:hypothetical protein
MFKEITKHKLAYFFLILGLLTSTFLFMGVWPNRVLQRYVIVGFAIFYIGWGVITHLHAEHISKRVIAEYVSVALLAGLLLFLITLE